MTETTDILKTRLHMTKLPCNYGLSGLGCPLCGKQGKIATEHYFSDCSATRRLSELWNTDPNDLSGPTENLRRAKNHLGKVETLIERHMPWHSDA